MNARPLTLGADEAGRIVRLAAETWELLGEDGSFPREPECRLSLAARVAVHDVAHLSTGRAMAMALKLGMAGVVIDTVAERPLRGCLLAERERASILVDPADPADERRMTVAHELGHFIVEIEEARAEAQRAAGSAALAVLDGARAATFDERLAAVLAGASLEPRAHLLSREADGRIGCPRVAGAECLADAFAFALLAPRAALHAELLELRPLPLARRWGRVAVLLERRFGLPKPEADRYAGVLVEEMTGGESARALLGF